MRLGGGATSPKSSHASFDGDDLGDLLGTAAERPPQYLVGAEVGALSPSSNAWQFAKDSAGGFVTPIVLVARFAQRCETTPGIDPRWSEVGLVAAVRSR